MDPCFKGGPIPEPRGGFSLTPREPRAARGGPRPPRRPRARGLSTPRYPGAAPGPRGSSPARSFPHKPRSPRNSQPSVISLGVCALEYHLPSNIAAPECLPPEYYAPGIFPQPPRRPRHQTVGQTPPEPPGNSAAPGRSGRGRSTGLMSRRIGEGPPEDLKRSGQQGPSTSYTSGLRSPVVCKGSAPARPSRLPCVLLKHTLQ